jgi:hypothetical protein
MGKGGKPQTNALLDDYDHSLRSPYSSRSLAGSDRGVMQLLRLTPSRTNQKVSLPTSMR